MAKVNIGWEDKADSVDVVGADIFNAVFSKIQNGFDLTDEEREQMGNFFNNKINVLGQNIDGLAELLELKANEDDVYSKEEVRNTFANVIKNSASGEIVSITDISPIEHTVDVKLSSDIVTDFSGVELSAQGENLFKSTNYVKGTINANTGGVGENTSVRPFTLTSDYIYLKKGDYVLSNKIGANLRFIAFYNQNKEFISSTWTNREKTFKFIATEDCYVRIDAERDANVAIENYDTFYDEYQFMLEVGTTKSQYEPYIEPTTYTPNADGTVDNVKSIYPTTLMYTDTSGVVVNAEYNADTKRYIDNKFAELQALVLEG